MARNITALIIGLLIGAGCRWFQVPVPAPPRLMGALLVLSITIGYLLTDRLLVHRTLAAGSSATSERRAPGAPD